MSAAVRDVIPKVTISTTPAAKGAVSGAAGAGSPAQCYGGIKCWQQEGKGPQHLGVKGGRWIDIHPVWMLMSWGLEMCYTWRVRYFAEYSGGISV